MQSQTVIRCASCGQPFSAEVHAVIDVSKDPQAKALLLNGAINNVRCPNCGNVNAIMSPLMYHDPSKELLVAFVPMEMNMTKDQQERIIGDMMNTLPKDNFKGYMFNPKRALTMQGLIETVLTADGVTPEMMAQQKERVRLAQQLVDASDAALPELVKQNDTKIDLQFFQTLSLMAQRMAESGQIELARRVVQAQSRIAELSSFGQSMIQQQQEQQAIIQEVAEEIDRLGQQAKRSDLLNLALKYKDDDDRLQAMVGIARPAFDYEFFQELTAAIGKAPADEREDLESLRDALLHLTQQVDRQAQAQLQNAVQLLQAMVSTPNPDDLIRDNLPLIDDAFMAVLTANIQEAERRKDVAASARLKGVYERIMTIVRETMQPELLFVNQLLQVESDEDARKLIQEHGADFDEALLEAMDAVSEVLESQGQADMLKRLTGLRKETEAAITRQQA